jgi:hypothetical protein
MWSSRSSVTAKMLCRSVVRRSRSLLLAATSAALASAYKAVEFALFGSGCPLVGGASTLRLADRRKLRAYGGCLATLSFTLRRGHARYKATSTSH